FPLPPVPVVKLTCVETPFSAFHVGLAFARKSVNAYVSPLESLRNTGETLVAGSFAPGFRAAICGSFQCVILPRYMPASTGPLSFNFAGAPFTWYETSVAASAHGTCRQPLHASSWSGENGASLAPKSTVRAVICAIPPPEPIAP